MESQKKYADIAPGNVSINGIKFYTAEKAII